MNLADRDEVFASLVAARSAALLRTAFLTTGHRQEAEDLLQTALAKTYLAWGRIESEQSVEAYVRRTMVTTHVSSWRRHRNRERAADSEPELFDPATAEGDLVERDWMWQALAGLPPRQRTVLVLRYYEEMSEAEIALAMGCSTGSVKTHASRGLATLRARLDLEGDAAVETTGGAR